VPTGFRARALVAEDEEITLNLLREILEGANFQVESVYNVADAMELVGAFEPHGVITDLNFGVAGPNGADLLLVVVRSTQMEMSLPSKLTSHLYSERPMLAAVPKGGATWKFLDGIAELVEAGKPPLLARAIEDLSRDSENRKRLASKSLEFASKKP